LEEPDILVSDEDVDEATQFAGIVKETLAYSGVFGVKCTNSLSHGGGFEHDLALSRRQWS
jgi:hypothetical protein